MSEMEKVEKWVLETAKDIDAKLCARAEKYAEKNTEDENNALNFEVQKTRIELIKAVIGN